MFYCEDDFSYLALNCLKQLSSLLKISVSFLFVFFSLTSSGGDHYRLSAGAGEAGMGYACIMKNGFWSSFHNQASLALNSTYGFGFSYENRFNIKELGTRTAGVIIPAGKTSIGALYSHFGYTDFTRQMTGISCGMKISDKISAGVQVDYYSERLSGEYNKNQSVTCETGLMITPSENLIIGIHLFNPVPNSLRKAFLPTRLRAGAGTNLSKVLFAGIEAEMSSEGNLIIKTGFEYKAAKNLWLRSGFLTSNSSFSFGIGYIVKTARIDLSFITHEKLGVSSSLSMIFNFH
jgi:hypothetical protein